MDKKSGQAVIALEDRELSGVQGGCYHPHRRPMRPMRPIYVVVPSAGSGCDESCDPCGGYGPSFGYGYGYGGGFGGFGGPCGGFGGYPSLY